jgi:protoporphyrinogen oxidase
LKASSFAYANRGQIYPLNQPLDLLRFEPLPFLDRLRVGVTGAWGRVRSDRGLDDVTAAAWLESLSGRRAFRTFWQPMLEAKFGDRYADVPALWFWTRFNREKGDSKGEQKGYIRGGYKVIIDALVGRLRELRVDLRFGQPVREMELAEDGGLRLETESDSAVFSQMVIALPWTALARLAGPRLRAASTLPDWNIDFQGVINHVLFLKRPLTPHYWLATPEPGIPFDGVVETSTLTDEADRGADRHVVYLTKYLHRDDPQFKAPEEEIRRSWGQALRGLFPRLKAADIEAEHVFRAPFVEPVYTRGYLKRRPPEVLVPDKVFLATSAQVYPTVTSWNGSVIQAGRTLAAISGSGKGCQPTAAT